MKSFIIIFLLLINTQIHSQELELFGKLEPGNVVIGLAPGAERVLLNEKELTIDENGYFLFGFDRDDSGEYLLQVKFREGKVILKKISLPERKYKIQKINRMKKELVTAPKSQDLRISKERKIISEARKSIGQIDSALYSCGIVRPVKGGRVTGIFGSQRILNGVPKNAHNGYDIASPRGTAVYAMADGVVVLAADTFYYSGNFIILDHGQGLNSSYLHLSKKEVKVGDRVAKGQKIGEIGTTGRSTGPHLHWSVQWYGKRTDPFALLKTNFPKSAK